MRSSIVFSSQIFFKQEMFHYSSSSLYSARADSQDTFLPEQQLFNPQGNFPHFTPESIYF
jgi:hypothetical protein